MNLDHSLIALALLIAASSGAPALAQPTNAAQLVPAAKRIGDEAIQSDHQTFDAMQARIKALNDGGRRVADYHLAKAQCWLDVSFHEYTRNDRSEFPQAALAEAGSLVGAMERKQSPLSFETPLVNGAAKLRPDLWAVTSALKGDTGFFCAQQKIACAEVELVHAGNEFNQQQWRHAKPYVQIAEDLIADAQDLAASCRPVATPVAVAVPMNAPAPVAPARVEWLAHVVFAFDRSGEADIHSASLGPLRELADAIAKGRIAVGSVRLSGHADRLNGTGYGDYNQRLSERRVQTVREMLVRMGVDPAKVRTQARGDELPVQDCAASSKTKKALEDCLLPNRRVEVLAESIPTN
ncbi:MAG TPA: OmpA family protein [Burkholderiaceae bacterium]|nr:OmpA family protein [Burkholderiaceae bacterium]